MAIPAPARAARQPGAHGRRGSHPGRLVADPPGIVVGGEPVKGAAARRDRVHGGDRAAGEVDPEHTQHRGVGDAEGEVAMADLLDGGYRAALDLGEPLVSGQVEPVGRLLPDLQLLGKAAGDLCLGEPLPGAEGHLAQAAVDSQRQAAAAGDDLAGLASAAQRAGPDGGQAQALGASGEHHRLLAPGWQQWLVGEAEPASRDVALGRTMAREKDRVDRQGGCGRRAPGIGFGAGCHGASVEQAMCRRPPLPTPAPAADCRPPHLPLGWYRTLSGRESSDVPAV